MLIYPADVASVVRSAPSFGVNAEIDVDWLSIRDRVFGRTDGVSADGRQGRADQDNVMVFSQRARLLGSQQIGLADGTRLRASQIVLATKTSPTVPAVITGAGVPFHTSDTVADATLTVIAWPDDGQTPPATTLAPRTSSSSGWA